MFFDQISNLPVANPGRNCDQTVNTSERHVRGMTKWTFDPNRNSGRGARLYIFFVHGQEKEI